MIKNWNFESIMKNFLRDNTKLLSLGFLEDDLLLKLNHHSKLISVIESRYTIYKNNVTKYSKLQSNVIYNELDRIPEEFCDFNLIISFYSSYKIEDIAKALKKSGHFLLEQKGQGSYNIENEVEKLKKSNFKIVKCNQIYDENGENIFYILAKKV